MRVNNSSKPPITYNTTGHRISVESKTLQAHEARNFVEDVIKRHSTPQGKNSAATSNNDVLVLKGKSADTAEITKATVQECVKNNDKNHNITQILLQPKKVKKQAAIYFDGSFLEGKKISSIDIDKSKKGRVKIKVNTLDLMA